ncbi:MAG: exodeoxyribonuclease VII small subunit [Blastocatellia bacterium]|nr:exodeoxyribonuclease VII small subunit [Blastocatellia bacterium]
MSEPSAAAVPTFEQSLEELEAVVRQLESGDVPLDQALELFERGVKLSRSCRERLDTAERRIEILLKGPDGSRTAVPFADSDSNDEDE